MANNRPSDVDLLQRIPGVGEKTSQRLADNFGDSPAGTMFGVTTASTKELAQVKGVTEESGRELQRQMKRYDIDRGVYDDDPRERKSETFGELSEEVSSSLPGTDADPSESGLVAVETDFSRKDRKRAEKFHSARSERAQSVDESLQAPIADSFNQWVNNKDEYDFPNVDTRFSEPDH